MKKFGKIMMYILLFMAIGTVIVVIAATVVDNYLYSIGQSSTFVEVAKTDSSSTKKDSAITTSKIKLDDDATDIQFSYNNKYYTYLKDGNLYIKKLDTDEEYDVVSKDNDIVFYNLLYDKNLILYITAKKAKNSNSTNLVIHTYDISSKKQSEYNSFNVTNFSKVKQFTMSPLINIFYINIETKGVTTNNYVYRFDLFNNMNLSKSGIIVNNMIMTQYTESLYYQNANNQVYLSGYNLFKSKVDLIGIDSDDKLYFLNVEDNKSVYVVKKGSLVDTIELSDSDVVSTYTNYSGVYIIYPTYVINVASENPYKRIGRLSKYVEFMAIKGNTMYLKTQDNVMVTAEISE